MAGESRRVLITGGAGFIGSHLADALIERGFRVQILDNLSTGQHRNLNPRAALIQADIRDLDSIMPAFAGVDTVFHEAALARVPLSIDKPAETHMVNALGTLHVLIAARDAGVRRVVFAGSSSVYGDQDTLPLHEQMTPNPLNPYALQKLVGEKYTHLFHKLYGMQTLTLRYCNVFGPRMATAGAYVTVLGVFSPATPRRQTTHGSWRWHTVSRLHPCWGRRRGQSAGDRLRSSRRPCIEYRTRQQSNGQSDCRDDR